jgi:chromate transporter
MTEPHGVSFAEAVRVWARVALLSFGGPAGQIAVMHRIIVEEKRWIGEERFLHALSYCTLLPGPEAQQLATYIGWLMHRTPGGLVAGGLFVLPGLVAIMGLSWIYVLFGQVPAIEGLFFGLKAAVLAIVVQALIRVGRRALANRARYGVAAVAFAALFLFDLPFPLVVVAAGLVGFVATAAGRTEFAGGGHGGAKAAVGGDGLLGPGVPEHARRADTLGVSVFWLAAWLVPVGLVMAFAGPGTAFAAIALFFSKMAVVTFGGAYAVLAYVAQSAVEQYHWLKPGEMLDGLAMAETTPGPLIMVLQFVGFLGAYRAPGALPPLLAGTLGGLLTTWVTFAPCFLWIFAGAPWVEALRGNRRLSGALNAITAAVVGVIGNLAVWFAVHALFGRFGVGPFGLEVPVLGSLNLAMAGLTAVAFGLAFGRELGTGWVLGVCAGLGVGLRLIGWT